MKLKYNSPVILTFAFICTIVLALKSTIFPNLINYWFSIPGRGGFNPRSVRMWICLFTYTIGHANWEHLVSNMMYLLLIGPMLESAYGSRSILLMMVITAFVGGVANVLFFKTGLLGASGVIFMMILLASFTNFRKGEVPITFILILILYIGSQFIESIQAAAPGGADGVAHFAHIIGGFCGSIFGFFRPAKQVKM
jgi:membrane associated rhomboid family serine protease